MNTKCEDKEGTAVANQESDSHHSLVREDNRTEFKLGNNWRTRAESIRKQMVDKLVTQIMEEEVLKIINEAYDKFFAGNNSKNRNHMEEEEGDNGALETDGVRIEQ